MLLAKPKTLTDMCIQHKVFAHLTQEDRFRLEVLNDEKHTYREISRISGIDVSVISREISRNKNDSGHYCAVEAQKKADERRLKSKFGMRIIENDLTLSDLIETTLRGEEKEHGDWSPEVIANTVLKGKICHETIYAWIKRSRRDLRHLLPQQGRRRMRYGSKALYLEKCRALMPSIELRPFEVESREQLGHFEGDTVVLKEGRIHTLAERKSRFLVAEFIGIMGMGLASQMSDSAVRSLSVFPLEYRRTITYDRGSEFAWWDEMEKYLTGTKIYFAHPHRPWERGTNERTNGLIRRYFPKGKRFATITNDDVAKVVWRLNHRPRKILQWRTPCEVFGRCCTSR
jgi:IS30 family transposase